MLGGFDEVDNVLWFGSSDEELEEFVEAWWVW